MQLTPVSVNDLEQRVSLEISNEEMQAAFKAPLDDKARQLFAARFSPEWEALSVSDRLAVLSAIAKRVEGGGLSQPKSV